MQRLSSRAAPTAARSADRQTSAQPAATLMPFRKLEPSTELARYRLELRQRVEALKAETAAKEKQAQVAVLAGEPAPADLRSADIRPADIHPATTPRGTRARTMKGWVRDDIFISTRDTPP